MPQSTMTLQAPPFGKWLPPSASRNTAATAMALGTEALVRLADALISQGWSLQEVDLRDDYRQPLTRLEHDFWNHAIQEACSGTDEAVQLVSTTLPHHISSVHLMRGASILKLLRNGTIELSGPDTSVETLLDALDRAIRRVWT